MFSKFSTNLLIAGLVVTALQVGSVNAGPPSTRPSTPPASPPSVRPPEPGTRRSSAQPRRARHHYCSPLPSPGSQPGTHRSPAPAPPPLTIRDLMPAPRPTVIDRPTVCRRLPASRPSRLPAPPVRVYPTGPESSVGSRFRRVTARRDRRRWPERWERHCSEGRPAASLSRVDLKVGASLFRRAAPASPLKVARTVSRAR